MRSIIMYFLAIPLLLGCSDVPSKSAAEVTSLNGAIRDSEPKLEIGPDVDYIFIRQKGFPESRPIPTAYLSSAWIEVKSSRFQSDIVMSPNDLSVAFQATNKLACVPDHSDQINGEGIEVTSKRHGAAATVCFISAEAACPYLKTIASADYDNFTSYNMSSIVGLAADISCSGVPVQSGTLNPWPAA